MSKTKHLDGAIEALSNKAGAKRAPRKAQVTIDVYIANGQYTVQANGRTLTSGPGSDIRAIAVAEEKADAIRLLGKSVIVNYF